jgi:hypothetical protein
MAGRMADAAALSVSLSPFLPSSVEEDEAEENARRLRRPTRQPAPSGDAYSRGGRVRFQDESGDRASAEASGSSAAFQPTHAVFTPRLGESGALRYRKPDDRMASLAPAAGAVGSTLAQPNYDDFLRRVSVVLYQHLRRCEKRHREQQRAAKAQLDDPSSSSSHGHETSEARSPAPVLALDEGYGQDDGEAHAPRATAVSAATAATTASSTSLDLEGDGEEPVDELFREEKFVTPQYKYTFVRVPRVHPLTAFAMAKVSSRRHVPSVDEIFRFCKHLFNQAQLSAECSIVCLIYIERLMEQAGVPLLVATWKPIVLCGLLLASKVWQDLSSWNVEISGIYPQYSLHAVNRLERLFLHHIQWDLYISASVYAKYYFALRSLTEKKDFRRRYNYTMRVDPPNSRRLEERSAAVRHELYSKSL